MINSWSFSRFSTYRKCPQLAKYKFVDKLYEPGSPAMDRGSAIHKLAEDYITKGGVFPEEYTKVKEILLGLRKSFLRNPHAVAVEQSWSFRKDWSETTWNDWNECWLRIKVDAAKFVAPTRLVVIDWKTGKFRADDVAEYHDQLQLYALGGFLKYPEVTQIIAQLVYVDEGFSYPKIGTLFHRRQTKELQAAWVVSTKSMLTDRMFPPTPSRACIWCHFRRSNGGPCKY